MYMIRIQAQERNCAECFPDSLWIPPFGPAELTWQGFFWGSTWEKQASLLYVRWLVQEYEEIRVFFTRWRNNETEY